MNESEKSTSEAVLDAIESGALNPEAGAKRVPFPSLGFDALVHPLSLRLMEKDQRAVGGLVGVLFKLGEYATPATDEDAALSDAHFWAVVLQLLPSQVVSYSSVVALCVTWERRQGTPEDKPEPDVRDLPHYMLPILGNAWVEVSFPDPLAVTGWVDGLARTMEKLAPEGADLSTMLSLKERSRPSAPESRPSESASEKPRSPATGSAKA